MVVHRHTLIELAPGSPDRCYLRRPATKFRNLVTFCERPLLPIACSRSLLSM